MNWIRKITLVLVITGSAAALQAQSGLAIRKVFDTYGKSKDAVMVELSMDVLQGYDFALFKSITISNNEEAARLARDCIAIDEKDAKKVKQVVANGVPTSVYLQLPQRGKYFRLILYNHARQPESKVTLIYIETEQDSEDVLKLILKKK
ncbi:MAG: DUF6108 family protein [Bacteroidales bacterium]|jgi:hypothetical protein|nr:DUF6108 family protein [Bacteroidales bacterium]OJX89767.1 MAG: hypothetical protein BGP01_06040 [Paludibacter sp. 47-17]